MPREWVEEALLARLEERRTSSRVEDVLLPGLGGSGPGEARRRGLSGSSAVPILAWGAFFADELREMPRSAPPSPTRFFSSCSSVLSPSSPSFFFSFSSSASSAVSSASSRKASPMSSPRTSVTPISASTPAASDATKAVAPLSLAHAPFFFFGLSSSGSSSPSISSPDDARARRSFEPPAAAAAPFSPLRFRSSSSSSRFSFSSSASSAVSSASSSTASPMSSPSNVVTPISVRTPVASEATKAVADFMRERRPFFLFFSSPSSSRSVASVRSSSLLESCRWPFRVM
mmetsp:Transcript_29702/g.55236  ORF Transcript_29702/g.55236 Transcript_29702/m.55236 type:complete len:288 (+) Transcript_29702:1422-2285(+)